MVVVFVVVVAVVGLVVVAGVVVFLGVILIIVFLGVVVVNSVDVISIEVLDVDVAVSCTTTRGEMTEMRPNLPKAQPTEPRIRLACTIFFLYSNFLSENGEKKINNNPEHLTMETV
jgi:hypothetical protein